MNTPSNPDSACNSLHGLLRAEGLALLLASLWAYAHFIPDWAQFALLFLLPDIALLAYLINPRVGSFCYNATHSEIGALALLVTSLALPMPTLLPLSLIWLAHIGFDRALGYGLKSSEGFIYTHLGMIQPLRKREFKNQVGS
jgi:Domain of unknown function (DUF4260)